MQRGAAQPASIALDAVLTPALRLTQDLAREAAAAAAASDAAAQVHAHEVAALCAELVRAREEAARAVSEHEAALAARDAKQHDTAAALLETRAALGEARARALAAAAETKVAKEKASTAEQRGADEPPAPPQAQAQPTAKEAAGGRVEGKEAVAAEAVTIAASLAAQESARPIQAVSPAAVAPPRPAAAALSPPSAAAPSLPEDAPTERPAAISRAASASTSVADSDEGPSFSPAPPAHSPAVQQSYASASWGRSRVLQAAHLPPMTPASTAGSSRAARSSASVASGSRGTAPRRRRTLRASAIPSPPPALGEKLPSTQLQEQKQSAQQRKRAPVGRKLKQAHAVYGGAAVGRSARSVSGRQQ